MLLNEELDEVLGPTLPMWEDLRGARVFLTGGTGFFGCWLLESLRWANQSLGLGAEVVLLTRDASAFRRRAPHLAGSASVRLHQGGDIGDFAFPAGKFTHVIHAASELSSARPSDPAGLIETTVRGARRVFEFARERGVRKVLFTSSGAVYGSTTGSGREPLREDQRTGALLLEPRWAYAEAKRAAEMMCVFLGQQHGVEVKIARGFAFLGPYLPLDSPLAAAGFIGAALRGEEMVVQGHGQTVRSYLYGADLAAWLWTILLRGESGRPYNVGSDVPITITELAQAIARAGPVATPVRVLGTLNPGETVEFYVPDVSRARQELGLEVFTPLPDLIQRTLRWHQRRVE